VREDIVLLHSLLSKHDRAAIESHAGIAHDLRQGEIALDRRRYDLQQLARLVEILKDRVQAAVNVFDYLARELLLLDALGAGRLRLCAQLLQQMGFGRLGQGSGCGSRNPQQLGQRGRAVGQPSRPIHPQRAHLRARARLAQQRLAGAIVNQPT
jgi:hypothetical protein